jgi:hypothetical protein
LKNNVSVLITSTHVGWIMTCPEFDVLWGWTAVRRCHRDDYNSHVSSPTWARVSVKVGDTKRHASTPLHFRSLRTSVTQVLATFSLSKLSSYITNSTIFITWIQNILCMYSHQNTNIESNQY